MPDVLGRPAVQSERAGTRVLLSVARAGKRLVSVGERGVIVLSDDNGTTWRQAASPVAVSLTSVHFATEKKGWAVGHSGVVLHSADGGETWSRQLDGTQAAALTLEAVKAKARDGGESERELSEAQAMVTDGPDKPFLDVYFWDENRGLIAGAYGLAFVTEDGGKHWRSWSSRIPNPKGKHLYSIHASGDALYITGERGALFRSRDGGNSFVSISTPYEGTYFGVLTAASGELLVFGLRGTVYRSANGGESWQKIESGSLASLTNGVRLADGSLLLVNEAGNVLQSTDGGKTFQRLALPHASPVSGIALASDGALILSGVRGVVRVSLPGRGEGSER